MSLRIFEYEYAVICRMETGGSSAASNSETVGSLEAQAVKRKSDDVGWDYGELTLPNNYDKIKCKLCDKAFSGGIYRLKQHIAGLRGNVKPCPKSTPLDKTKCLQALEGSKKRRQDKKERIEEVREEVEISRDNDDVVEIDNAGSKPVRPLGPMDQFARAIYPDASMRKTRQQNINDALFKNRTNEVHTYLAKWVYGAGIPFNAIINDDFQRFCEAVGQFGPGYMPPSQHQLREPLLKKEVERTKQSLKEQEDEWKKSGCSIMTDAWSDRKRRSIMNLCVNCKLGTSFLSSIECSNEAHTAKFIFEYVDKYIQEVGSNNVIQVVTDNASNNMAAAKLLREKRPHIFWTSCATHTLNLMLEAIGNSTVFLFTFLLLF